MTDDGTKAGSKARSVNNQETLYTNTHKAAQVPKPVVVGS